MKRVKSFIPLFKKFFAKFIDDLIDALIGFLFGAAVEAIINLEFLKAIIFIAVYFVVSISTNKTKQKNKIDKQIKNIKSNRGIKNKKIVYIIGGLVIIYIVLFYEIKMLSLLTITYLLLRWLCKHKLKKIKTQDKNYKLLVSNLICHLKF